MMLLLLAACERIQVIPLNFDGPVAGTALTAGSTPFVDPIGFIANSRSGTIVPLNIKENRLLTDDPLAAFVRASALATGDDRILADVAATTDGTRITLWAVDTRSRSLLQIPYVTGLDAAGNPIEVTPTADAPTFQDADGSGDSPTIQEIVVRAGYTTTEDWSINFDGTRWWAQGSQSGTQVAEVIPGETWRSDEGELEFVLEGTATAGDGFTLHTETNITQWSIGQGDSLITHILATPPFTAPRVYASVVGGLPSGIDGGVPTVSQVFYLDVAGDEPVYGGAVILPDGAAPGRMARASDGRIFVADTSLSQVYVLDFEQDSPLIQTIATPAPVIDLAWSAGTGADGSAYEHLFVASLGLQRVDVWDLSAQAWHDPNPDTPEPEGIPLGAPIGGMATSIDTVWFQHANIDGAYPRVPMVAVTTQDGLMHPLDASTGCEVFSFEGPHGPTPYLDSQDDYIVLEDQGELSSTLMWLDEDSGQQIVPSACGGVTRSETWTVTYDSTTQSYEVEGSFSGIQNNRAVEDERYISDTGAISFLIVAGTLPTTDGDRFSFSTDAGVAAILGTDSNEDGEIDRPWELPGRPVAFDYLSGPTGGGWDEVYRQEFMLVPVENGDITAKVLLDDAYSTIFWD